MSNDTYWTDDSNLSCLLINVYRASPMFFIFIYVAHGDRVIFKRFPRFIRLSDGITIYHVTGRQPSLSCLWISSLGIVFMNFILMYCVCWITFTFVSLLNIIHICRVNYYPLRRVYWASSTCVVYHVNIIQVYCVDRVFYIPQCLATLSNGSYYSQIYWLSTLVYRVYWTSSYLSCLSHVTESSGLLCLFISRSVYHVNHYHHLFS